MLHGWCGYKVGGGSIPGGSFSSPSLKTFLNRGGRWDVCRLTAGGGAGAQLSQLLGDLGLPLPVVASGQRLQKGIRHVGEASDR